MATWSGMDGIGIAGDFWGDPAGTLVVLLHGGGQTRHAWKGTGQRLGEAGYFAVALDARGHGDSDWAQDGLYSHEAKVEDLREVIRALGKSSPILIGASMGGATSLIAVGEGRIAAAALVLVDIAPRIEVEGVRNIRNFMNQKPDGFESLDEVADAISSYQPHRPRPRELDGLSKNVRLGSDGRYHWHWDPNSRSTEELSVREARLEACARNLSIPTLLIRGGLSDVLSEAGVQSFLDSCPHAEYVNVGEAAHMVAGDRNDLFGNAVLEFLGRRVPARS